MTPMQLNGRSGNTTPALVVLLLSREFANDSKNLTKYWDTDLICQTFASKRKIQSDFSATAAMDADNNQQTRTRYLCT